MNIDLWNALARKAGITLSDDQHRKLARYLELLLAANQKMNLTRITDPAEADVQHVGDALTILPFVPSSARALGDLGSGGGCPGIPLAIARPDLRVTLIEATRKKAMFLQQAATELALPNLDVRADRAETLGQGALREALDVVTARAVGTLDWLVEWGLPLLRVKGTLLAMKGRRAADELAKAVPAIPLLGGGKPITHPVELPGADSHVIIQIPKVSRTPAKYPRSPTHAKGKPLGVSPSPPSRGRAPE